MKSFMINTNKIVTILILLILSACEYDRPGTNIAKARELKHGMTINEVKRIMGTPDDSLQGYFDKDKFMFIYETSFFVDDDINIYFDGSKKTVTNIVFPNGY